MFALPLRSTPLASSPSRIGPGLALPLWLALGLTLVVSACVGGLAISMGDWLAPWRSEPMAGSAQVLWHLRLPRALLAAVVGAALALAGALSQGLFRNPMADPGLLGVTSGAACAAALVLTVFSKAQVALPPEWRMWLLPVASFAGAVAVCYLLDRLARWLTPGSVSGLLLTGLALNALTMAVVGLCTYLATDEQLRSLSFWTLGSLAGGSYPVVALIGGIVGLAALRARSVADGLNALALGEAAADHVGIDVQRLRGRVITLVALLCALAVAWCGVIGFIGLMAPHLVRVVAGPDQRRVLPLSMLAGALLLGVADTLARTVVLPAEIPVGIFTALIGGPVFLLMLRGAARSRGGGL